MWNPNSKRFHPEKPTFQHPIWDVPHAPLSPQSPWWGRRAPPDRIANWPSLVDPGVDSQLNGFITVDTSQILHSKYQKICENHSPVLSHSFDGDWIVRLLQCAKIRWNLKFPKLNMGFRTQTLGCRSKKRPWMMEKLFETIWSSGNLSFSNGEIAMVYVPCWLRLAHIAHSTCDCTWVYDHNP